MVLELGAPLGVVGLTADFAGLKGGGWIGFGEEVDVEFFVAVVEVGGLFEVEVGEDEEAVFLLGVLAEKGDDVAGSGGDDADFCVGVKGGVEFGEGVDAANPVDLVVGVAPVEAVGVVDVDLLGGEPFEAVGEAEGAVEGGEGAEGGSEAGEGGGGGGEAGVVVGFGEVDEVAFGAGDF